MTDTTTEVPTAAAAIRLAASAFDPDPFPDRTDAPDDGVEPWQYHPGQYELGLLHRLVAEGFAANRFVHYAKNYGELTSRVRFRRPLSGRAGRLTFRSNGAASVLVDGAPLPHHADGAARRRADLPARGGWLEVEVTAPDGEPAALLAEDGAAFESTGAWESSISGSGWRATAPRIGTALLAPHDRREPLVTLPMAPVEGIFELPAPVLGRPVIDCDGRPTVVSGESAAEARDADAVHETRHDVVLRPDGRWTTVHELGFRFLAVSGAHVRSVSAEASVHPVTRRGAFVCADPVLSRIWAHSAFTLRSCMHELMLDGIKRDRMPWMGDQALNTLANAYAFGEGGIVRDGIIALGQPRHGYVNGISDYSLWWLINSASYVRLFGDAGHAIREADHIHRFTERLATHAGPGGVFRPGDEPDAFTDASDGSVFLDWGVTPERGRDLTALQILWFWALRAAAGLLEQSDHDRSRRWSALAEEVRATLLRDAWDDVTGSWTEYLDGTGASPYPNFLAVLSGLSPTPSAGVTRAILAGEGRIGTPFMASFALRGLVLAGHADSAVARIRERWSAMLDAGAVTFWEEFPEPGAEPLGMYGRPYGKSLCHAWAAGPAALLPEAVLGIRPGSLGWDTLEVAPALGDLPWAAAVVPLPGGDLVVSAAGDAVTVEVPPGSTLLRASESWTGPCRVSWRGDEPGVDDDPGAVC